MQIAATAARCSTEMWLPATSTSQVKRTRCHAHAVVGAHLQSLLGAQEFQGACCVKHTVALGYKAPKNGLDRALLISPPAAFRMAG